MKRDRMLPILLVLAAAAALCLPAPAAAQDPAKVAPDIYKCTFENERVRVCEVTAKPGAKIGMHSHPEHFAYVLAPGKLRITKADGAPADADLTVGSTIWFPAETHSAENIGATEVKVLVVELKEPPAMKAAKPAGAHN